ncbi:23S rRNA (guanosine(2251)-2'-O)-methyltransferase RlmB [bacterium]|nr:23S rRNA (guanosine(2251)-2'-O)-methyltransferase RlmB [candidate division CSSED10-310 bacterium]
MAKKQYDNLIYGRHPVSEYLKEFPDRLEHLWVQASLSGQDQFRLLIKEAKAAGAVVSFVDRTVLNRLAGGGSHQGIVLRFSECSLQSFQDWQLKTRDSRKLVIALDEIQDPQNLGSIARTAAAVPVDGILVPKRHGSPFSSTAMKASAGTLASVPLIRTSNLAQSLSSLKHDGMWIVGISMESSRSVLEFHCDTPTVLVFGNENKGLRPIIRKACDDIYSIPLWGPSGSLNVSVAAAIVLYEIVRKRLQSSG